MTDPSFETTDVDLAAENSSETTIDVDSFLTQFASDWSMLMGVFASAVINMLPENVRIAVESEANAADESTDTMMYIVAKNGAAFRQSDSLAPNIHEKFLDSVGDTVAEVLNAFEARTGVSVVLPATYLGGNLVKAR